MICAAQVAEKARAAGRRWSFAPGRRYHVQRIYQLLTAALVWGSRRRMFVVTTALGRRRPENVITDEDDFSVPADDLEKRHAFTDGHDPHGHSTIAATTGRPGR